MRTVPRLLLMKVLVFCCAPERRAGKRKRQEEGYGHFAPCIGKKKNDTQQREFFLILHFTTQLLVVYGEPLSCQLAANRGTT